MLRTQAKKAIWDTENPPCTWAAYNARLERSRRWYEAADTLGWGLLVLIPSDTVTPHWVEQTLRAAEWNIWLQLVQRVNPATVAASHDFDAWLSQTGIEHGSLEGASWLTIEAGLEERITKAADSDDEGNVASDDDNDDSSHDGHGTAGQLAITLNTHPIILQSLDLHQLFQPYRTQA
jgi:hypothetical protein